jgi:predicted phosphodiesterase
MRYGIISDIHGNLEALQRVLEELEDVDEVICLGDIVGYGANPNECCQLVRERCSLIMMGNHDAAVVGLMDLRWFNAVAAEALLWTRSQLSEENINFLSSLQTVKRVDNLFLTVHGSLRYPIEEYIFDELTAYGSMRKMPEDIRLCFFGHTHVAEAYSKRLNEKSVSRIDMSRGGKLRISSDEVYLINCGSVGQPRDGNSMAGFGIYDVESNEVEVKRIMYDIETAARKILRAGLPPLLAQRLFLGR